MCLILYISHDGAFIQWFRSHICLTCSLPSCYQIHNVAVAQLWSDNEEYSLMLEWTGGSIHHHNELDWSEHPQKDARSPKTSVLLTDGGWNSGVQQRWDLAARVKLSWVILKQQLSLSLSLSLPPLLPSFFLSIFPPSFQDRRPWTLLHRLYQT